MNRIIGLKNAVQSYKPAICTERTLIWTDYCKNKINRKKPPPIQIAEALRDVLLNKSIKIYPDELIVGNYSSKRVGGTLQPELAGLAMMSDLYKFSNRKTNPLEISKNDIKKLRKIIPFWLFRMLGMRAYKSPAKKIRLVANQLTAHFYLINESGGIAHIAPDYEKLIKIGIEGIKAEAIKYQRSAGKETDEWYFYEAVMIAADALAQFGERYAKLAGRMADEEEDPVRKSELKEIANVCLNVPRYGAKTLHEAIQSIFFAQIALNTESMDNSICPGRMDFYLYPFYESDIRRGLTTRERAKELLSAFSIKLCEIVPVNSEHVIKFHGGFFNGQVVTVGGVDSNGNDSSNEISYIFLEIMDELRMRQPNYHARIHSKSPEKYIEKVNAILTSGANTPALYNDDIIIKTMVKHGYSVRDARNYTAVGCVEPVSQGKSFSSTDAALFNVPIILELALNEGRRFGHLIRSGAKTQPVSRIKAMEDVKNAFEAQLDHQIKNLITDLQAIEIANRKYHPTPLTSSLLDGCLESGRCSTAGGAAYNFSGIQCVGPADTGDSLYAIEKAVFTDKKLTLAGLVGHLKNNLKDNYWHAYLKGLEKFGNDEESADRSTIYVIEKFRDAIGKYTNTRGGRYVVGLYSVTSHKHWGNVVGALPNGRRMGQSFASGIAPSNGMDKKGPTALLNSVNRIDFTNIANGVNLNLKFEQHLLNKEAGRQAFSSIVKTYFKKGGMQFQVNVLDPKVLMEAKENPELYPYLLVRVSGYSAYFNDLTPEMKDEIISRSVVAVN